jgi:serine/threonine protein phosphatase 1
MIGDPVSSRRFVVTDIHGCAKTLKALLKKVTFTHGDELYVLGDLINKGPRSKQVLDTLMKIKKNHKVILLIGNHEKEFLNQLDKKKLSKRFKQIGGRATLKSFGVKHVKDISPKYLQFIQDALHYYEEGRYILVHAGLDFTNNNPLKPSPQQYKIRNWYKHIDRKWLEDRIILHGHSPITKHRVKFQATNINVHQYLDLDAGCVYHKKKGKGNLAIFELNSQNITFQKNIDH